MQGSKCLSAPGCCIARLTQGLSLSGGRLSEVVSWNWLWATHGLSCSGTGVTWAVLAGTHRCATESRVTLRQSANPCCVFVGVVGVVTSCVPCVRVSGRTSRSCATENTYTPAPLEALFKLSVVAILNPSYHLRQIFLRVVGALSNSSSCSTRSSSRSRSRRNVLACLQYLNPSCSRECQSVCFSVD